jgi:transcriptional regulator with XRE-family HTH domain
MIKNERQYKISKSQVEKFETALAQTISKSKEKKTTLGKLESRAISSQLEDLRQDVLEYEELRAGERSVIYVDSFDQLSTALVQARIASGLTHKELAEKLDLKEQQIQRYESTNYASASLTRIEEIVSALGVQVRKELFLPVTRPSSKSLFERLKSAGIDRKFVLQKLLPSELIGELIPAGDSESSENAVRTAASILGRVYRWSEEQILGSDPLELCKTSAGAARFKLPTRADAKKLSAYTIYAHYLALLVLEATPKLKKKLIPTEASNCRSQIEKEYGELSFQNILSYVWDLGIPVLPLADSGAFHGACWRTAGRNVVVLKQRTNSLARWSNDCLHETFHAGQEPDEPERSIIEEPETSEERMESDEELDATMFAGDVLLDGRAEELVGLCVDASGGNVPRFKKIVPQIANQEGVGVGALANYMAFRLSQQDINWWGTAANLQSTDDDPWAMARDELISRMDLKKLNDVDREILLKALTKTENSDG